MLGETFNIFIDIYSTKLSGCGNQIFGSVNKGFGHHNQTFKIEKNWLRVSTK